MAGCAGQPHASAPESSVSTQVAQAPASAMAPMGGEASIAKADAEPVAKAPAMPRKIIFTGEVTLICEDLDKAAAGLEARAKEFGGYISNASQTGARGETREGSWTVRIAAEKFDAFLKALPALGELQSSSRKADDVSEEFYDVAARLKNKKIEEDRLIELLQKATGKLTEVLTVEKELSRVRDEIERIEGRLRFLTNQTDLSTITITLREVKNFVPEGPPTLATQVSRSFSGSVESLKNFLVGIVLVGVALVPWVLPLGLTCWLVFQLIVKKRR
ncbi:DUF4349 domain-containing protein [Armatimonas rosea]|uniref:DUF4349 domain-containing protein n=1 Tax=Armatimonas rosea TaxID=685828 RepID=A0A7W9SRX7_ARMRO|nr:hypothetical protein [Armatimonas rosea]